MSNDFGFRAPGSFVRGPMHRIYYASASVVATRVRVPANTWFILESGSGIGLRYSLDGSIFQQLRIGGVYPSPPTGMMYLDATTIPAIGSFELIFFESYDEASLQAATILKTGGANWVTIDAGSFAGLAASANIGAIVATDPWDQVEAYVYFIAATGVGYTGMNIALLGYADSAGAIVIGDTTMITTTSNAFFGIGSAALILAGPKVNADAGVSTAGSSRAARSTNLPPYARLRLNFVGAGPGTADGLWRVRGRNF
jgi:hypothetical protein